MDLLCIDFRHRRRQLAFHTHATRWALLSDVIPIAIFILLYTWYALRRFAAPRYWSVEPASSSFLIAAAVPLTGFRGGSYVSALVAMVAIGGLEFSRGHVAGSALSSRCGIFRLLRCGRWICLWPVPTGDPFAWHVLNAAVLFIVARDGVIRQADLTTLAALQDSGI